MNTNKTLNGLAAHAKSQIGMPYLYGADGQELTAAVVRESVARFGRCWQDRARVAEAYAMCAVSGKRAYDAVGLVLSYLLQDNPEMPNSASLGSGDHAELRLIEMCNTRGAINEKAPKKGDILNRRPLRLHIGKDGERAKRGMEYPGWRMERLPREQRMQSGIPEEPGLLAFRAMRDNWAVGVYVGGGMVVEAHSFERGVILSKLSDGNWSWWGRLEMRETEA